MKWSKKNLILGVVFLIIFGVFAYVTLNDSFDSYKSFDLIVSNRNIEPNQVISLEDLQVVSMDNEYYTEGMLTDVNKIIGKMAVESIPKHSFFSVRKLDESMLRPSEEHEFFPIPNDWIMNLQGSIRRYDLVNVIAVPRNRSFNSEEVTLSSVMEPVLSEVPVVYVKNNNNHEVLNAEGDSERLVGTTRPANIELSLTLEEFKTLEALYLEGYNFLFSY